MPAWPTPTDYRQPEHLTKTAMLTTYLMCTCVHVHMCNYLSQAPNSKTRAFEQRIC